MARANTVWLVLLHGSPKAAFTVKHELKTWLGNQSDTLLTEAEVWRMPDCPPIFGDAVSVTPRRVSIASL